MKAAEKKTSGKKDLHQQTTRHEQIKTDFPISEKDEVKQAEEKMRRTAKKS